jgi:uroporphyrinogen-III synthase
VQPYIYAPASDSERVAELVHRMAAGEVDAVVFTSSPQVDRLFAVAEERGIVEELRRGFGRTQVASVGPVLNENLNARSVPVHICPEQGFVMKNLVQQIKRALGNR